MKLRGAGRLDWLSKDVDQARAQIRELEVITDRMDGFDEEFFRLYLAFGEEEAKYAEADMNLQDAEPRSRAWDKAGAAALVQYQKLEMAKNLMLDGFEKLLGRVLLSSGKD